jgi:hypothetical protein
MSNPRPGVLALLGPQRTRRTVREVLDRLAPGTPVATVTAGWQEREGEDTELNAHLGGQPRNLALYRRAERVWRDDPELRQAHHAFQSKLRLLRETYNVRLAHAIDAWAALERMPDEPDVLDPERLSALEAVRDLDASHLRRAAGLRAQFEDALQPPARPAVRREREEITRELDGAGAIAIAGGHVAVLLNRLLLFGLADLVGGRVIVAWAAGAMALAERVVLFHDSPPQGPGHAEALVPGLGVARDVIPLPHAGTRLRLDDQARVSRFARRFGPAASIALDPGEGIERTNGTWTPLADPVRGARRLDANGRVEAIAR